MSFSTVAGGGKIDVISKNKSREDVKKGRQKIFRGYKMKEKRGLSKKKGYQEKFGEIE